MTTPESGRTGRIAVLVALATGLLAACSGSGGGTSSSTASATAQRAPLTGDALAALLPPPSYFAARGFRQDADATRDTGAEPQIEQVSAPSRNCSRLATTAWTDITGISGTSFAQADYLTKDNSRQYSVELNVYNGTTSSQVLTRLAGVPHLCGSFTDKDTNSPTTVTGTAVPGLGSGAYRLTVSNDGYAGTIALLAVRRGSAVVGVLSTQPSGTAAVAGARALATLILSRLGTRAG